MKKKSCVSHEDFWTNQDHLSLILGFVDPRVWSVIVLISKTFYELIYSNFLQAYVEKTFSEGYFIGNEEAKELTKSSFDFLTILVYFCDKNRYQYPAVLFMDMDISFLWKNLSLKDTSVIGCDYVAVIDMKAEFEPMISIKGAIICFTCGEHELFVRRDLMNFSLSLLSKSKISAIKKRYLGSGQCYVLEFCNGIINNFSEDIHIGKLNIGTKWKKMNFFTNRAVEEILSGDKLLANGMIKHGERKGLINGLNSTIKRVGIESFQKLIFPKECECLADKMDFILGEGSMLLEKTSNMTRRIQEDRRYGKNRMFRNKKNSMQKEVIRVGEEVILNSYDDIRSLKKDNSYRQFNESQVSIFFASNSNFQSEKRIFFLDDIQIKKLDITEIKKFYQYAKDVDVSSLTGDGEFVEDKMVTLLKLKCPSLFQLVSILIRNDGRKDEKAIGTVSVILSNWGKKMRFFAKYFQPILIPDGVKETTLSLLNSYFSICYAKKWEPSLKDSAKKKIEDAMKIKSGEVLFIGPDNCTVTSIFRFPVRQQHFINASFRIVKSPQEISSLFSTDKITNAFCEELVKLKFRSFSSTFVDEGDKYVEQIIPSMKKRKNEKFVNENLMIFAQKPIVVKSFTREITYNYTENMFEQFTFENPNKFNLKCHISDFHFMAPASAFFPVSLVQSVFVGMGFLHFAMATLDAVWKVGRRFIFMDLNIKCNLKCPYSFSSSRYPRFKHLFIVFTVALSQIWREYNFSSIDIEKSCNSHLRNLYGLLKLCRIFFCFLKYMRLNNLEEIFEFKKLCLPLFSSLNKSNYLIGTLDQVFRWFCTSKEAKEFLKKFRLALRRFQNGHKDVDELTEEINDIIKTLVIGRQGIESWRTLVPLLVYFYHSSKQKYLLHKNQKKENQESKKKEKKKWLVEQTIEKVKQVILGVIDPGNSKDPKSIASTEQKEEVFFQENSEKRQLTTSWMKPYLFLTKTISETASSSKFKKYIQDKQKIFNEKGTLFQKHKIQEEEEEEDVVVGNSEDWDAYCEGMGTGDGDNSSDYVPPNDEEDDEEIDEELEFELTEEV